MIYSTVARWIINVTLEAVSQQNPLVMDELPGLASKHPLAWASRPSHSPKAAFRIARLCQERILFTLEPAQFFGDTKRSVFWNYTGFLPWLVLQKRLQCI